MIHRRTLRDDSLGVGEPINETAYNTGLVVCGKHFLLFESPESSAYYHRHTAQRLFMNPLNTYALPMMSYTNYSNNYRQTWSALNDLLPFNIHLLTMDQLTSKIYLIRIEHYFELNEDEIFSKPVDIDLQIIFNSLGKIRDLIELTLTANLPLNQMKRLIWKTNENLLLSSSSSSSYWISKGIQQLIYIFNFFFFFFLDSNLSESTIITLNPMEIRTFQVTLQ